MKRYFINYMDDHDEDFYCMPISAVKAEMKERGLIEAVLTEAKLMKANGEYLFCLDVSDWSESGNCGRICDGYAPRNGKNGICKHYRQGYEPTGITRTIKIKP